MNRRRTSQQRHALDLLYRAHDMVRGPFRTAIAAAIDIGENGNGQELNNLIYDQLRPGQKLTDPKRPGLMMRHGKQHGRYWIFRTTRPLTRQQIEIPMGDYPTVGIAEARTMWRQLRDLRKTDAPLTEHIGERHRVLPASVLLGHADSPDRMTVEDLVSRYIRDYARKVKRSADEDERILHKHIVPVLGSRPVDSIEPKDITQVVHSLHDRAPREAEKLMACLSTMFNVAKGRTRKIKIAEPWLPDTVPSPMASVPPLPARKAENYTPPIEEMHRYIGNLPVLGGLYADALNLQALTATRISEAVELPWSEVDLEAGRWVLPASRAKNGAEHIVFLSAQAVELLRRRRDADPDGQWVFPSVKYPDAHASADTISKALKAKRSALDVDDRFVSHSVRHAATTWLAEQLIPIEVRDRVLNHLPPASRVDSVYNAAALNQPARIAWQRWADALSNAEADDIVVPLEGRK